METLKLPPVGGVAREGSRGRPPWATSFFFFFGGGQHILFFPPFWEVGNLFHVDDGERQQTQSPSRTANSLATTLSLVQWNVPRGKIFRWGVEVETDAFMMVSVCSQVNS